MNEQNWEPLGVGTERFTGNYAPGQIHTTPSPLTRNLKKLVQRVFYIPAGRSPQYNSDPRDWDLNQDRINQITPLLKRLSHDHIRMRTLQSAIALVFDEVSAIKLIPIKDELAPHVLLTSGDVVPIDDMGYGFRNAVQILTIMSVAPPNALILIDEPEQGLNQSRQSDFAKLIEELRKDLTLIIATQAEAFCKGLETSRLYLSEKQDVGSAITSIDIRSNQQDRKRLARAMGINPLYLMEGGKIVFVEGSSDQKIVDEWLTLNFGGASHEVMQVQDLGGAGKIGQEFAKPMFLNFAPNIFFLLDSDGSGGDAPVGSNIQRLVNWFKANGVTNFYVLNKREIENYIGYEAIAIAADINSYKIKPPVGREKGVDLKAAVEKELGFYDENKITVNAYKSLAEGKRKQIFNDENDAIIARLRDFVKV